VNERQFQQEFVAEAPTSVPESLRERVEGIPSTTDVATDRGQPVPRLGLKEVVRRESTRSVLITLGSLLIALVLVVWILQRV